MTMMPRFALASLLMSAGAVAAQDQPEKVRPVSSSNVGTALRVQIVYSRYQGEKKISSVPHSLSLNADERPARLRMGIMVPIVTQTKDGPTTSYRDVGNNIDCMARSISESRFRLECSFEQSSLYDREKGSSDVPQGLPMFRNFRSESNVTLRDGQSAQHTSATDPVTGEVLKIDITLNVVK
jgi:Flp pilus assembly secretin CpaC